MLEELHLPLIIAAAFIAAASPGPATLAIAGTSMESGRQSGMTLAMGIWTGSLIWSVTAAAGLSAIMLANAWLFEIGRYLGSAYLAYLAFRSARSAWVGGISRTNALTGAHWRLYGKGLALHLTNPKAILFLGSLYAVGVPANATLAQLAIVIVAVAIQNFLIFQGYALLFSTPAMTRRYLALRRWFDAAFAIGFGLASLKVLTARLG